jgi:hypothetical protein
VNALLVKVPDGYEYGGGPTVPGGGWVHREMVVELLGERFADALDATLMNSQDPA